jgi:amino acid permease
MANARRASRFGSGFRASFVLFGTIVGAGIFGLPFVVQQSGYLPGLFWMIVLAAAVTLTHLLYAEVVMATPGQHRLVGYVRIHLGPWAERLEAFSSVIGLFGSSLAYLILGGLFVSQISSAFFPVSAFWGSLLLFSFGLMVVKKGTAFLSGVDFWMTLVEMGSILLLAFIAATAVKTEHLTTIVLDHAILPYGIVLFAYGGLTVVTEVREIVGGDPRKLRRSVVAGTLMAVGLTIAFVTAVVGGLGPETTPEAVGGLSMKFGGSLPLLGAIAGLFSILTSYIVFTDYLNKQFRQDFGVRPFVAAAAAVGLPFLLYLLGIRSFGRILELVGAVLIGVEGMFVALMYLKVKREKRPGVLRVPNGVVYLLLAVYAAGALYAVFNGH